jgi:methionyl-tRNA formyltransferase
VFSVCCLLSAVCYVLACGVMRIVFFGTAAFAVPSLETLVRHGHEVALCVTQPDRPRGRGLKLGPSPVKEAALRFGISLAQPERLASGIGEEVAADVGVVAAYGMLIPRAVLSRPAHGLLGVHPSLLPAYRGAAPVAWAILRGETQTGVSVYRLNERLDAGDVLIQRAVGIEPEEDAGTLTNRLSCLGAEALAEGLDALGQGRATFTPQDESRASLAPKLTKAQRALDWRSPADMLARTIRAMNPSPGAFIPWQGTPLKLCSAAAVPACLPEAGAGRPGERNGGTPPGTVMRLEPEAIVVATGEGVLAVTALQPAGRKRMTARAFLAGHPLHVGELLGDLA